MRAFIHIDNINLELAVGEDSTREETAKEISSNLSMASSVYLKLKDGNYIIIPEQAFAGVYFTTED